VTNEGGEQKRVVLYRLPDTAIKRHIKVKGSYNPFDLADELYGEKLRQQRMLQSMSHRREWVSLYREQGGLCALCGCKITRITGWHDHHIIHKVMGGSDALSNRVLLHPVCHTRVHILGLKVVKLPLS
jgi:RNA-directed DNA polymerase